MKRNRITITLIVSTLAGLILALALPASAADCPPLPPVASMLWVLSLGLGAVGAGAGGYLLSGRVRTRRRALGIFALGLGAFGLALLTSPVVFGAQESAAPTPAAPVVEAPHPWYLTPEFSLVCGIAVFAALEALKRWPAAQRWLAVSPLRDWLGVLTGALLGVVPLLLAGATFVDAARHVGVELVTAFGAWAGQHGLKTKAAQTKAAELDGGAS